MEKMDEREQKREGGGKETEKPPNHYQEAKEDSFRLMTDCVWSLI